MKRPEPILVYDIYDVQEFIKSKYKLETEDFGRCVRRHYADGAYGGQNSILSISQESLLDSKEFVESEYKSEVFRDYSKEDIDNFHKVYELILDEFSPDQEARLRFEDEGTVYVKYWW